MRFLLTLILVACTLLYALPAIAGNWGENWSSMMWNEMASLPALGIAGLTLLAMGLAGTAAWALRKRRPAVGLMLSLVLLAIPMAVAAGTLAVPNTFVNGTMADADEVNANFDAVEAAVNNNATPPGAVIFFATETCPTGWLPAGGGVSSRSSYPDLYASIGDRFGSGDGSTTFGLPDLRGEFIRGWDAGRGIDMLRALGTAQSQDFKSFAVENANGPSVTYNHGPVTIPKTDTMSSVDLFGGTWSAPSGLINFQWDASEIRPRNVALLACIKT